MNENKPSVLFSFGDLTYTCLPKAIKWIISVALSLLI